MLTFFSRPLAWPHAVRGLLFVLMTLGAAGCGNGKRYGTVSGQVLRQGKPVIGWYVVIDRRDIGMSSQIEPDLEGRFAFKLPLEVGTYTLSMGPILSWQLPEEAVRRKLKATSIPKKYQDPKTSGWTLDVHEGKNEVVLEITE